MRAIVKRPVGVGLASQGLSRIDLAKRASSRLELGEFFLLHNACLACGAAEPLIKVRTCNNPIFKFSIPRFKIFFEIEFEFEESFFPFENRQKTQYFTIASLANRGSRVGSLTEFFQFKLAVVVAEEPKQVA